ncbi:hypothetical protein ETH_00016825 [Eimeria tenella]|uniref:Uncharacterized protein n=1 Tax=Eimeria tenella TaxID=5802 RepID=U6KMW3_EIMTE|nr:hypothetical protein ETH_00016825 [Eimeria tenella]CDJ38166.1 hypothetical protein ETH_00016825 [Eimeria tenella]|eukprot:XP_013229004.1 hypothetical protein ETH_00016825 [Eimeria tenella]
MAFACGVSRHFFARSERVKAVALHPREPLVASAQYDGRLKVHNYFSLQLVAALDVSALPLRAAAFLAPRDWLLCAGDDCALRAFSLHSQQKVAELLNAHKDYIRHLAVHAHKPLVLSSSDDMTIKLWDVEDGWTRLCSFESHAHYVMQSVWSPRDPTIFASCSLDRSIKVWGIGPIGSGAKTAANGPPAVVTSAHFSLLGHERGVNTIAYST